MTTTFRHLALPALAGLLAACAADGAGPSTGTQVTFNLATRGAALTSPAGVSLRGDTLTANGDVLVLDSVQLVLRDIRFHRVNEAACDDDSTSSIRHDDGDDDNGDDGDSDACEAFNAGPFLLDLPLDTGVTHGFSVAVDTGSYDELRLKLHKPEDDSGDPKDIAFLAAHPDFAKVSIRAMGSFNGTPFTFESDLNAEQRMDLVPALVVADSLTNVDVTIRVDVSAWFADGLGGLVDPATGNKGGANDNLVKDNIRDSFHAFRDDDRDGDEDDDDND